MKVMAIIAHPDLENSRVNSVWLRALEKNESITVVNLTARYPDMKIDIFEEQMRLLEHDRIIFVFPLYWYSCPPILKAWLDDVLQPGFAYANEGDKLEGKEFVICTSIGGPQEGYRAGGHANYTLDELLRPLQQTVLYIGGKYLTPFSFYRSMVASDEEIESSAQQLLSYVLTPDIDPRKVHEDFSSESIKIIFARHERQENLTAAI
jgi:glutathione-regulated potassium-efflux system ancillary protein KefG